MTWFIHRSYWQQDIKKCEYVKMILKGHHYCDRNGMDILSLMGGSYIVDSGKACGITYSFWTNALSEKEQEFSSTVQKN